MSLYVLCCDLEECRYSLQKGPLLGFPEARIPWLSGKESPANAGDRGLIPDPGIFHMLQGN